MENSTPTQHWYDKTWLVVVLCIIFFPVGLYALWKSSVIGKGWKIAVTIFFALLIIAKISDKDKSAKTEQSGSMQSETTSEPAPVQITVGQPLTTDYFQVTVNDVVLEKERIKGSFTENKPEPGNAFLILNTTFKNIDTESRTIFDGSVFIISDGKEYEFDKSETIMADGYGVFLDQINPLTSKTTKLVYQIPVDIKGKLYYNPGRSDKDQRIYLGDL